MTCLYTRAVVWFLFFSTSPLPLGYHSLTLTHHVLFADQFQRNWTKKNRYTRDIPPSINQLHFATHAIVRYCVDANNVLWKSQQ